MGSAGDDERAALDGAQGAGSLPAVLTPEFAAARIALQLVDARSLPTAPDVTFNYAPEWMPRVKKLLSIHLPSGIVLLNDAQVAALGPLEPWFELGALHTWRLTMADPVTHEVTASGTHWVEVALSTGGYLASMALHLPHTIRFFHPSADLSHGVLFAIPFRHQFVYRIITDRDSVESGLAMLPRFGNAGYVDGDGPISPQTYLWHADVITQVPTLPDGAVNLAPGSYLQGLLDQS